jgi:hydrogenase maturation protein HypF
VAGAAAAACERIADSARLGTAVLGGGVFQNRRLVEALGARLEAAGLEVLVPRALPPNDGAISYGQAAIAAARG